MGKGTEGNTAGVTGLAKAWEVYDGGDEISARRLAKEILASQPPSPVKEQAEDLIARAGFPLFALRYIAIACGLVAALITLAVLRQP